VLGILGLLPGMPNGIFLTLAALTVGAGYWLEKRARQLPPPEPVAAAPAEVAASERELGWDDVSAVDLIGLEVGYRLIPLVDRNQSGPLLGRIKAVRRKLSEELGFLIQSVHIRDNLELKPSAYRISILGVPVGEGEIHTERDLAINPGGVTAQIIGLRTKDPAFGLDAYWIEPAAKEHAQGAALFESLVLPFVAMLSVPLSFVAIPFTFWATGESFDRTAYVGLILLAGIAINNALLLVHRAGRLHRRLGDPARAARLAAVERVRPILLTTFTSIAGLVPLLWTGTEAMSATWRSLALSATAGLAASSAFTLFVIPCLFTLLARRGSPRRPVPSDPKGVPA
jgi:hypothetical protein